MSARIVRFAVASFAAVIACAACPTSEGSPDVVIVVAGNDCRGEDACVFDFGAVGVTLTGTNSFVIKNAGEVGTNIVSVQTSGDAVFSVQDAKGGDIGAHATENAVVAFAPSAQGTFHGDLVVTWDAGSAKTSVTLTGKGN